MSTRSHKDAAVGNDEVLGLMRIAFLVALLLPLAVMAAEPGFKLVQIKGSDFEKTSYALIEDIESGPWLTYAVAPEPAGPEKPRAERWRLLRIPPAKKDGRLDTVVEKIVQGADGCCQRVAGRWRLELPKESDQAFKFIGWTTPTSFIFELGGQQFTFSGLQAKDPVVKPSGP